MPDDDVDVEVDVGVGLARAHCKTLAERAVLVAAGGVGLYGGLRRKGKGEGGDGAGQEGPMLRDGRRASEPRQAAVLRRCAEEGRAAAGPVEKGPAVGAALRNARLLLAGVDTGRSLIGSSANAISGDWM